MTKKTGDQYLMKQINKNLILDAIFEEAPLSRADIASKVGLNKGTVSNLVNEWIESKLVYETGLGESSGGRKPMMLLFHDQAGFAIGIDLGINEINGVVTDLRGLVITEHRIPMEEHAPEQVLHLLVQFVKQLEGQLPPSPYGLIGIGIGVPGIVDDTGLILSAPNLGWSQVPLLAMLQQHFDVPIVVDNEANAGALCELQYGTGRDGAHVLYISVGIGIGAGIILNNELYRGMSGFSGEIGHMAMFSEGERCRCGNIGCWEVQASEHALLQKASITLQHECSSLDQSEKLQQLITLARQGNPKAISCFQEVGQALGLGITNLIHIFNPERVVIGNRISLAGDLILHPIQETIRERCLPYHHQRLQLALSEIGTQSTARGAATMAVKGFFHSLKSIG